MPAPITAPIPSVTRLTAPSERFNVCSPCSPASSVSIDMGLMRSSLDINERFPPWQTIGTGQTARPEQNPPQAQQIQLCPPELVTQSYDTARPVRAIADKRRRTSALSHPGCLVFRHKMPRLRSTSASTTGRGCLRSIRYCPISGHSSGLVAYRQRNHPPPEFASRIRRAKDRRRNAEHVRSRRQDRRRSRERYSSHGNQHPPQTRPARATGALPPAQSAPSSSASSSCEKPARSTDNPPAPSDSGHERLAPAKSPHNAGGTQQPPRLPRRRVSRVHMHTIKFSLLNQISRSSRISFTIPAGRALRRTAASASSSASLPALFRYFEQRRAGFGQLTAQPPQKLRSRSLRNHRAIKDWVDLRKEKSMNQA